MFLPSPVDVRIVTSLSTRPVYRTLNWYASLTSTSFCFVKLNISNWILWISLLRTISSELLQPLDNHTHHWHPLNGLTVNILKHSYNKTNQMHWFLKFVFGTKLYMFRTVHLSIIGSFSLCTQQWYMSHRFTDSLRTGSGRNCTATCMTYTIAVCTVKNSRWWTEELSETCRV